VHMETDTTITKSRSPLLISFVLNTDRLGMFIVRSGLLVA
jgi:hypothetical protein